MNPTTTRRHAVLDPMLTLGPAEIDQLPWWPVPGCPGVVAKELWSAADLHDALISYEPGSTTPGKPHMTADQHIWVVSGSASIAGRPVLAGSYQYVPPGIEHPIVAGVGGCLLLQMHRRLPTGEATDHHPARSGARGPIQSAGII